MSIQTNKMKAIVVLLKRVTKVKSILHHRGQNDESIDGKLEKLRRELNKIKDVFVRVKQYEDQLLDTLAEVDDHLRKLELDQDMDAICNRIRDSVHKLLPMDHFDDINEKSIQITQHNNQFLWDQEDIRMLLERYNKLEYPLKNYCMGSIVIFPKGAVINKRRVIYLLIGEYFLNTEEKTAEERSEEVIDVLLKLNLIVPYGNAKFPLLNKFQVNPHIHPHLDRFDPHIDRPLLLEQQKVILSDEVQLVWTVYNVGASYLNFKPQWLAKQKRLRVLQLGRWQHSPSHHIEVGSQEFLTELRYLKYLSYLSLRGISRIFELPPSITQLKSLEILDLKACHNLETLPDDISPLINLTHLIMSQCYLLDAMPMGIDKLTKLQVLKGYLISTSRNTPCRISDLANLKNLRQLSIRLGPQAVIKEGEFKSLGEMSLLKHLKITWGVSKYSDIQIILPSSLKKLHLEGFPGQTIPEWLKPSKLSSEFKELKIMGGKLQSIDHDDDTKKWGIEILHLKYLKHLKVDSINLQDLFPSLRYAEIKRNSNLSDFEWSID